MPVQDDSREQQMVALFNLTVPADRGRSDVDAHLKLAEVDDLLPFELKSTTGGSVSTVRDFGPEHIAKWRGMHWIFAFYEPNGTTLRYCYYASPVDMQGWIAEKEQYIRPDMVLAEHAQDLVGDSVLTEVLGDAEDFSVADAHLIMKKQWKSADYRDNADLPGGRYSRSRMIALMQDRLAYVIRRGSTLNNPHISERYFESCGLHKITEDHAAKLRELVRWYLANADLVPDLDEVFDAQASAAASETPTA